MPGGQRDAGVRRADRLDAHVLAGQDVDRRPARPCSEPLLHLHTQYNRDIPWAAIDMDFMNLNQAAHGDREFGFMAARMRLERKVVVGHWTDAEVQERDRRLDAGRLRAGATGRPAGSPGSARTCARSRSPTATRSRRSAGSGSASTATASATSSRSSTTRPTPRSTSSIATYLDEYDVVAGPAPRRRSGRRRCATARGSSSGCAGSSTTAASSPSPTTFEDLHGLTPAARASPSSG